MEIKWIKITTDIFDDEKIRLIESMPESDTMLVIWFKLLAMAGRTNDNGSIYISKKMSTTDEMLATIFRRPLNTVRMALQVFESFEMIEVNKHIDIINWEKHQNIDGMEKIRKQNTERQRKFKEKKKEVLELKEVTLPITLDNATDKEEDKEKDKNKKKNNNKTIVDFIKNKNLGYESSFMEFAEFRISKKKPLTELTVNKIISQLDKWNYTDSQVKEVFDNSIMNGWQGIFELKKSFGYNDTTKKPVRTASDAWLEEALNEESDF